MISLCRYLLHLYPADQRAEFGEEMSAVLQERQAEIAMRDAMVRWVSYAREIGGLLGGAAREHVRAMTSSYPGAEFSIRGIRMRSEFRFPKATPVLMTVILGAVVMTIEKARAIQTSVPEAHPQVGPIHSADFTVLPSFMLLVVLACAVGALGWAIVFAMRRSGVHRWEELKGSGDRGSNGGLSS